VFTIGYVGRYARYLGLDVENLQQRLEAEMAAHDGSFTRHVDIEVLPDRKFPIVSIACVALLVAALIYARDDVVSLATRTFDQATVLAHDVLDTPAPAVEQQREIADQRTRMLLHSRSRRHSRFFASRTVVSASVDCGYAIPFDSTRPPAAASRDHRHAATRCAVRSLAASAGDRRNAAGLTARDLMPATTPARIASQLLPMPCRPGSTSPPARLCARVAAPEPSAAASARHPIRCPEPQFSHHATSSQPDDRGRSRRPQSGLHRSRAFPGDTYRVPDRAGLWLTAVDASAVEILLDGSSVGFAGPKVRR
jgi:hypothetical protein